MRKFNSTEKKYIHLINSGIGAGRRIDNMLDNELIGFLLELNRADRSVRLKFELSGEAPQDSESLQLVRKVTELQVEIVILCNLLRYLEENGYIAVFRIAQFIDDNISFGQASQDSYFIDSEIVDGKTIELLFKYIDLNILPTSDLIEFEQLGFVTPEEKRVSRQINALWASVVATLIIGFIGVGQSCDKSINQIKYDDFMKRTILYEMQNKEDRYFDYMHQFDMFRAEQMRADSVFVLNTKDSMFVENSNQSVGSE